ncbi:helix-turn-helix domain-containing protein [Crossiella sp. SN42]|uniref:helix-turn-helix transcriptional regulator n=1 Tax=Crossiella sp. SN42 TaxID=2944808 RepID=UPI00207D0FCA|nr:helix-turn-helix domain-containing protein [Crossiella sp. SN42]MCO1582404.1 helix-turn-helix domain-containing protein [Crossiella sp. SN42]
MHDETTRYLRVNAVAERYDISKATIYRAIKAGKIDALLIGKSLRIPESALPLFEIEAAEAARQALNALGHNASASDLDTDDTTAEIRHNAAADGRACLWCGADFLTTGVSHLPVGRSATGSQVFVCITHPQAKAASSAFLNGTEAGEVA